MNKTLKQLAKSYLTKYSQVGNKSCSEEELEEYKLAISALNIIIPFSQIKPEYRFITNNECACIRNQDKSNLGEIICYGHLEYLKELFKDDN